VTDDKGASNAESEDDKELFRPLGDYAWPVTPIDRGLKRLLASLVKRFRKDVDKDCVDESRLVAVERSRLDQFVATPTSATLATELDATLSNWLADDSSDTSQVGSGRSRLQTIVLPPCDRDDFLRGWAIDRGHVVVEPPPRNALVCPDDFPGNGYADADILVIPRLEDWFLRHDSGLAGIRELVARLAVSKHRWLIGCNAWAWQFLVKSCHIDATLSDPLVPAAFDADRLRDWLEGLSCRDDGVKYRFRLASSGKDVFSNAGEQDGANEDTMAELAEVCFGIPWVAWHVWRSSLRTTCEPAGTGGDDERQKTFWITGFRHVGTLQSLHRDELLVLHTLLVHGYLPAADISRTVPIPQYKNPVGALVKLGLIEEIDGLHACVPAAYPAIRQRLQDAGFPMDVL